MQSLVVDRSFRHALRRMDVTAGISTAVVRRGLAIYLHDRYERITDALKAEAVPERTAWEDEAAKLIRTAKPWPRAGPQVLSRLLQQKPQTGQGFFRRLSLSNKLSIRNGRRCLPIAGLVAGELQRLSASSCEVRQSRREDCFFFQFQGQSCFPLAAVPHLQRMLLADPQMFTQGIDCIGRWALRESNRLQFSREFEGKRGLHDFSPG
jgi:hypothetical protein